MVLDGPVAIVEVLFFDIKDRLVAVLSLLLLPSAAVFERLVDDVFLSPLIAVPLPLLLPSAAVFVRLAVVVVVVFLDDIVVELLW